MRIIWFTLIPSPHICGLLNAVAARCDLTVVYEVRQSPLRNWKSYIPDCNILWLNSRNIFKFASHMDMALHSLLRHNKADIYIVGTSMWSINTWIISKFAKKNHIPLIFMSEPPNPNRPIGIRVLRKIMGRYLFKMVNGYAGVTRTTCQIISKEYRYSGPDAVVPYHSDLKNFLNIPLRKFPNSMPKLLCLGTLTKGKRIDLVISALKDIPFACELIIVGDGPEKQYLQSLAMRQNNHLIRFLPPIPYSEVSKLFEDVDYLVFPSDHDGFGMITMEALSAGIPVIASDRVMSAVEYIMDGKNGWIFPHGNSIALTKILCHMYNNKKNWADMSRMARQSIQSYFPEITADRLLSFIKKIY